jgi:hypothetical protein
MKTWRIVAVFFLFNIFLCIGAFYASKELREEIGRLRIAQQLAANRLAMRERNLAEYHENILTLAQLTQRTSNGGGMLIPYAGLADALADVSAIAANHGLRETSFETLEPILYETDADGLRGVSEVKACVTFEGDYGAVLAVIYTLTELRSCYRLERFTVEFTGDGPALTRLDFALYGIWTDE